MLNSEFYELTQAFQGAIFQAGIALQSEPPPFPSTILLQLRRGYAESPGWFLVQAQEFEPEPLSVGRIRVRAIWSSERIVAALLDLMASEKWLDRVGEDYHLTDDGRIVIQAVMERRHKILAPLTNRPEEAEFVRLENLMRRVLDACLTSAEPPSKWCLAHSRHRTPAEDVPAIHKLFQHGADFNAYRDDAHMAAFQPLGVSAYAWEAFSHIWQGVADSAQAIFDQLPHRGYSRSEYTGALDDLSQRGWIESIDGEHFRVTESGQSVREEVERQTDAYFYGAWSCLNENESEELVRLTGELKTKLEVMGQTT